MKKTQIALAISLMVSGSAFANTFVNGGFEDGNINSWTGAGPYYRNSVNNTALTPALVLGAGGANTHSAIIDNTSGYVDPNLGAALGTTVYSGRYSYRVEDLTYGGYASVISQSVTNYTDANIFFAWKAVLEAAHSVSSAAVMKLVLRDDTAGADLITRTYTAIGSGVDSRFNLLGGYYYTPDWQIEQLAIGAGLIGHNFTLSLLASDCQPTGHAGYVYLDGFGSAPPVQGTPEPASLALMGLGLAGLAAARKRKAA